MHFKKILIFIILIVGSVSCKRDFNNPYVENPELFKDVNNNNTVTLKYSESDCYTLNQTIEVDTVLDKIDKPYILTRDLVISDSATLTIENSVNFIINPSDSNNIGNNSDKIEIIVNGNLNVNGINGKIVTIQSNSKTATNSDWDGITYNEGSNIKNSNINYLKIADAINGISIKNSINLSVVNSSFYNCKNSSIKAEYATLDIQNSLIKNTEYNSIKAFYSTISIKNILFAENHTCLNIFKSNLLCQNSLFYKNNISNHFKQMDNIDSKKNIFYNSTEYGIYVDSSSIMSLESNVYNNNTVDKYNYTVYSNINIETDEIQMDNLEFENINETTYELGDFSVKNLGLKSQNIGLTSEVLGAK